MKFKTGLILTAALIIPGGFIVLGAWKVIELLKEKNNDKNDNESDCDSIGNYIEFNDFRNSVLRKNGFETANDKHEEQCNSENVEERKKTEI